MSILNMLELYSTLADGAHRRGGGGGGGGGGGMSRTVTAAQH